MGQTLVEKILARHTAGQIRVGDIVSVKVDRLLINDYVGEMIFSKLDEMGCQKILCPERIITNTDHNLPAFNVKAADKYVLFKEKSKQYGFKNIEVGEHGIGHQIMCERFVHPHEVVVATDSHATMYAGLGAFSCGITTSDAIQILLTGECWFRVPQSVRIRVKGRLQSGVTAKDLSLALLKVFPPEAYIYSAVEVVGEAIRDLSVDGRLVIANLMAESGAKCAVFEADDKTYDSLRWQGEREYLSSDEDAQYAYDTEFDASLLEPMLAYPDAVVNVKPIGEALGKPLDQVFIGSCTNGRLEDLMQAAEILKDRHVADGVRLIVTPASQKIALEAVQNGCMEILMKAGAMILTSSCASCAGNGPGLIGRGERCLSTTNRNFKGRMGSKSAEIYLGSAYTAAASAVTGKITDPRIFLKGDHHESDH